MGDPGLVKGPDDILLATRRLYEAMYRFDVRAAEALGLHVTDLRCVNALEEGPLTAGEIGTRLALTSGSVTALVNRLVDAGFAERVVDPKDRRRALVALTPRFRSEADRIYARLGRAIGTRFTTADSADHAVAARVIATLAEGFQAVAGSPTDLREDEIG
jgi:DNA-binding MarR family transcriptional regulator